jgi:MATE family multidrug resistance protein
MLALPIIGSMISQTVMQFVDFAMVSRLGTDATAAVMPAGIAVFCFVSFGMGVLSMINTFVSQSLGRQELRECGAYMWQGLYLAGLLAAVVTPFILVVEPFFQWVGHEPAVQVLEIRYARIMMVSVFPAMAGMVLGNFFTGIHRPAIGLVAMVIANILNLIANYLLIFGHFGFPRLGIAGAAWGTVVAGAVQGLLLFAWMLRPTLRHQFGTLAKWRPNARRLWKVFITGLPAGLQHAADIVTWTAFTLVLVGRQIGPDGKVTFDPVQQAASNIAIRYLHLAFMPSIGLGIATSAAVGRAIGQGAKPLARTTVRWATLFAMLWMGGVGLAYWLLGGMMAGAFSEDPAVIEWARRLLLLCAVFQLFDALGIVSSFALRGAGDIFVPALIMMGCALVFLIGGGYALSVWWQAGGSLGPWLAATVYISILGSTLWARWQFGPWEKIELLAARPSEEPSADPTGAAPLPGDI